MGMHLSEAEWKKRLTPEQYNILREKGTELPGSGRVLYNDENGTYMCAACGKALFSSSNKYVSTTPGLIGWPSFSTALNDDAIELRPDNSGGMQRTEVVCKNCGGHLGHLFADPSTSSGQHYCINSVALDFRKEE